MADTMSRFWTTIWNHQGTVLGGSPATKSMPSIPLPVRLWPQGVEIINEAFLLNDEILGTADLLRCINRNLF